MYHLWEIHSHFHSVFGCWKCKKPVKVLWRELDLYGLENFYRYPQLKKSIIKLYSKFVIYVSQLCSHTGSNLIILTFTLFLVKTSRSRPSSHWKIWRNHHVRCHHTSIALDTSQMSQIQKFCPFVNPQAKGKGTCGITGQTSSAAVKNKWLVWGFHQNNTDYAIFWKLWIRDSNFTSI